MCLTLPMLRLLSSQAQGRKDFWKPFKPCHVSIHWIALVEYFEMSTHLLGFQSFSGFLHHFVLAKLATTSIRVNLLLLRTSNYHGWLQKGSGKRGVASGVVVGGEMSQLSHLQNQHFFTCWNVNVVVSLSPRLQENCIDMDEYKGEGGGGGGCREGRKPGLDQVVNCCQSLFIWKINIITSVK